MKLVPKKSDPLGYLELLYGTLSAANALGFGRLPHCYQVATPPLNASCGLVLFQRY